MNREDQSDLQFEYFVRKSNAVAIYHHGKLATTLRGTKALDFIEKMGTISLIKQQQIMARVTGNYKRGNERRSKEHPKNR